VPAAPLPGLTSRRRRSEPSPAHHRRRRRGEQPERTIGLAQGGRCSCRRTAVAALAAAQHREELHRDAEARVDRVLIERVMPATAGFHRPLEFIEPDRSNIT